MARRTDIETLQFGSVLRKRTLALVCAFSLRTSEAAAVEFDAIAVGYRELAERNETLPEASAAIAIAEAHGIAAYLCRWAAATLVAAPDADRHLRAAQSQAELLGNETRNVDFVRTREALTAWLGTIVRFGRIDDLTVAFQRLAGIPLPVFFSKFHDPYGWIKRMREGEPETNTVTEQVAVPIVKLMFSLDNMPLTAPQAVRSHVQYDFRVAATVMNWPPQLPLLELNYVSTMDCSAYSLTPFVLHRGEKSTLGDHGHLLFYVTHSLLSEPVTILVRARFMSEDRTQVKETTIIGHPELYFRALDVNSYPILTTYPMVDIQIMKILEEAKSALPDVNPSDFNDFAKCLIHLARYAGMVQQSGEYKGRNVDEKRDLQNHLLQALRMTEMGPEVKEGERSAGGVLDLRYRNIVIELKVEKTLKDRSKMRKKYISQPSQYSITGVPLSITCILDMVEKKHPPANVANNITLETPTQHGFEEEAPAYPSKVAVVIIDGNIKSPSDYS